MQLEATDWSIRPTLVVHPQGFTPTCGKYWVAANNVKVETDEASEPPLSLWFETVRQVGVE